MLQGLGVTALASILTNTRVDSKGSSHEDSGSEYDPQENEDEDTEQEELDKVLILVLCLSLLCWGFGGGWERLLMWCPCTVAVLFIIYSVCSLIHVLLILLVFCQ